MSLCSYQQDTVVESEEKNTDVACQKKRKKKKVHVKNILATGKT
jgi:hypothetical protein